MSGAVSVHDIAIVSGTLVVIIDHDRNGGSRCKAFENTRENLYFIVFLSGGRVTALARFPPVQIRLDILCERGRPAGHPSITAPMAGPWDSPQVVTVNNLPNVDPDIIVQAPFLKDVIQ